MAVKTPSKTINGGRIEAFDILRGLMLAIMLVDHIELYPSLFDMFTGRGRLFVSAAEGFFFLSGLLVGMVYKRRIAKGTAYIFKKMWIRAGELYVLAAITTIGYAAWAVAAGKPEVKYGLPNPLDWPHLIQQTLLLRYGFGWSDFLMRFSILMFIAPFAFYLLRRGWWKALIAISAVIWIFRGQNFTAAWQLLFMGGMAVGYYWLEINQRWQSLSDSVQKILRRWVYILAGITFTISYLSVYLLSYLNERPESVSWSVRTLVGHINVINEQVWVYAEKWTLGPLRIALFALWFIALFAIVQKHHARLNSLSRGVLELLGKNSLFVYLLHSLIVFCFWLYIPRGTTIWQNFLITFSALSLLIAGTWAYQRARQNYPQVGVNYLYSAVGRLSHSLIRKDTKKA